MNLIQINETTSIFELFFSHLNSKFYIDTQPIEIKEEKYDSQNYLLIYV
jgi:hypothetical protein